MKPGRFRRGGRLVLGAAAGVLAGVLSALPALAGDTNFLDAHGPAVQRIDLLWTVFLVISIIVLVTVGGAILFAAIHFRRRSPDEMPKQVYGNRRVELAWTIAPLVVLAGLFGLTVANIGYIHSGPSAGSAAARNELHIRVVGRQFYWTFYYPNGKSSLRTLVIPVNVPIAISTESLDVIHGFSVPELGAKIDALPGIVNHDFIEASQLGSYQGQCYEFCGVGHDQMLLTVKAVTMAQYRSYVKKLASP